MQLKRFTSLLLSTFALISSGVCFAAEKINSSAIQANLQNPQTNIKYFKSCAGEAGECITFFSETQVQMMQATALAQEYIKNKHGYDIICSAIYRTDWQDDYIKCSDKTGAANYYEFKFDDVKESIDNTIQTSVANALCDMQHGFYNGRCSIRNEYSEKLKSSAAHFGYKVVCKPSIAINRDHSICYILFNPRDASTYELKTAFGIDPHKFANLQIQSISDLEFLLKRYTERQVQSNGQELSSFSCAKSFQTYQTGKILNPKDDILPCTANGKQIDFLFDDINETFDFWAKAGTSGLNCIADSGGTFDGKNCHGLTHEQCTELDTKVPGGTSWDTMLDTCILNAAQTATNIDKFTSAATTIGISGGLIVATVLTGGSAIFIVAGAVGTTGAFTGTMAQDLKDKQTRKFLANSTKCRDSKCAESTLKEFVRETVQYYDDINGQLLTATDEELARLLNLIPEDSELLTTSIEQAITDSQDIRNFSNWTPLEKLSFASNTAIAIGAVAGLTSTAQASWTSICARLNKIVPAAKTLTVLSGTKTIKSLKTLSNIGSALDSSNSIRGLAQ